MLKSLLYVWAGLIVLCSVAILTFNATSLVWPGFGIIGVILAFLIPLLITFWHNWKHNLKPNHTITFFCISAGIALLFSCVLSVPLTLVFRPLIRVDEIGLSYAMLALSNLFLTALPVLAALHMATKHFQKLAIKETSLIFFALTGLLSLPIFLLLSMMLELPNSFTWFYSFLETHQKVIHRNDFPEIPVTSYTLPDGYLLTIADKLDKTVLNVSRVHESVFAVADYDTYSTGIAYCPKLDIPFFTAHHFVSKTTTDFVLHFDKPSHRIDFSVSPFEVYAQLSLNAEGWQQIGTCQTSITTL